MKEILRRDIPKWVSQINLNKFDLKKLITFEKSILSTEAKR